MYVSEGIDLVIRRMKAAMSLMPGMITCREADEFLLGYLEGTLPPGQLRKFKVHILFCLTCRRYLRDYRRTVELGKNAFDAPDAPADESIPEDLVKAILAAKDAPKDPET